jgi:hypothetical protein
VHESAWGRLIAVLVSPARTFESIAARPTWAAPLIVLMILSTAGGVLAWQRVDVDQIKRNTAEAMEKRGQPAGEEQLEQIAGVSKGVGMGCSVVIPPIAYLISALVLWAAFKIAGGEIGFKSSFSVTLHGMMPWAIYGLLAIPVVLAQKEIDPQVLQAQTLVASSPASFMATDTGPVLLALLGSFDVFSFWTIALLTIGFSIVAKVKRGTSAATVILAWLFWIAVKLALAWVGGAFGGAG